ncbi:metallophosphoesterase, partial [Mammaliicoccus sciuri]
AIQRNQVELLLIAGDISNNYKLTQAFIKSVEAQAQIKVLFIPGNHDFWSADTNATSAEILEEYMGMEACLIGKPYHLNDAWAIVGNTGWY